LSGRAFRATLRKTNQNKQSRDVYLTRSRVTCQAANFC
jgi:hypothetical protein